ncbi:MAG TPA: hypothetical protein VM166_00900 [Gemmatimonadaceae bacterium]|nr:hypothetical protein [Gemmatimonadaceae bacterium]
MNSYDNNVVGETLLDLPQLRKNVDAVYSPIGPEIEENHLSAQAVNTQRLTVGMNPVQATRKIRGSNARKIGNRL